LLFRLSSIDGNDLPDTHFRRVNINLKFVKSKWRPLITALATAVTLFCSIDATITGNTPLVAKFRLHHPGVDPTQAFVHVDAVAVAGLLDQEHPTQFAEHWCFELVQAAEFAPEFCM
jgi:hypothetical protein